MQPQLCTCVISSNLRNLYTCFIIGGGIGVPLANLTSFTVQLCVRADFPLVNDYTCCSVCVHKYWKVLECLNYLRQI